ncbi:MAG: acyl--CoA ligase [Candidatus Dadabacteria bacterium]|nr:MAG: acyl--CoA ligase [Candidatus Dadabacteria bacterium]
MKTDWLIERMRDWGGAPALAGGAWTVSYATLLELTEHWRDRLSNAGFPRGGVLAIEGDYGADTCALLLAVLELRAVAVPLASAIASELPRYEKIAGVDAVARIATGESDVTVRSTRSDPHPLYRELAARAHAGLVLFSSGSTGEPKAAVHDLDVLLEKFRTPRHRFRTCAFLLFDHIGGINTFFYTMANGGLIAVPPARDPDSVCRTIERHRIELLPASPTFLNLLLISEAYRRHDLSSLKRITYGTEIMPESTLRRLAAALPGVRLQQTYGLSELGILRSKSKARDSLWVKVGGEAFETKVEDGTLRIRARSAMLGYLNAPSPFDEDGWFDTGDLVEVDGEYVRFLGRRNDVINVGGEKVFPAEVESALMDMPGIRDATVYGEPNPITGQAVVAEVLVDATEPAAHLRRRVRRWCAERLAPYKVPARVLVTADPRVTRRFKKLRKSAVEDTRRQ